MVRRLALAMFLIATNTATGEANNDCLNPKIATEKEIAKHAWASDPIAEFFLKLLNEKEEQTSFRYDDLSATRPDPGSPKFKDKDLYGQDFERALIVNSQIWKEHLSGYEAVDTIELCELMPVGIFFIESDKKSAFDPSIQWVVRIFVRFQIGTVEVRERYDVLAGPDGLYGSPIEGIILRESIAIRINPK